jgi:membrane protein implicated in regulation of membrane protease activity
MADGWAIAGGVLALLGAIFGVVGLALTLSIIAALVGLPFLGVSALLLVMGAPLLVWRYQHAQRILEVLEHGQATLGRIVGVHQSYHVRINGRYPWTVRYRFQLQGRTYEGTVTTLSRPDLSEQPGKPAYVLYAPDDPQVNVLYPMPYGYYTV